MIDRQFLSTLTQRLQESPAVVLLGPRQVGKTTLALQLADQWSESSTYLDLERPADRLRLDDADAFLRSQGSKLAIGLLLAGLYLLGEFSSREPLLAMNSRAAIPAPAHR